MNIEILSLEDLKKKAKMRRYLLCPYLAREKYGGENVWKCGKYKVYFWELLGKETSEGRDCCFREICMEKRFSEFWEVRKEYSKRN